jgi:hypothetical protein
MPEKCHTINCNEPVIANGLCQKHYKRLKRHGHTEQTRSKDWGQREKHPAYRAWCGLRRYHLKALPADWSSDFWNFVKDVPEKPEGKAIATRPKSDEPWGPTNFYWRTSREDASKLADKAAYMREWQRKARKADPSYGKNSDLKRTYGIDLNQFKAMFANQKGVCAICEKPETATIRGAVVSLAVDHCHISGSVRGLLCMACNRGIGLLKHDVTLLQSAISYLEGT